MNVRNRPRKQHPRINLWQCIWLLTRRSALWPEENIYDHWAVVMTIMLPSASAPLIPLIALPMSQRQEGARGRRPHLHKVMVEEGLSWGSTLQKKKNPSFLRATNGWETIPKAVGRKAEGSLSGQTETVSNLFSNDSQLYKDEQRVRYSLGSCATCKTVVLHSTILPASLSYE